MNLSLAKQSRKENGESKRAFSTPRRRCKREKWEQRLLIFLTAYDDHALARLQGAPVGQGGAARGGTTRARPILSRWIDRRGKQSIVVQSTQTHTCTIPKLSSFEEGG